MLNLAFPEVVRFYRAAAGHRVAARALLDHCPEQTASVLGHEAIYLSGYVVECSLKALLLTRFPRAKHPEVVGWFKRELKHDLERLKVELRKKGVGFPTVHVENLKRVRTVWGAEMRYNIRAWQRGRAVPVFLAAEGLFEWVVGD